MASAAQIEAFAWWLDQDKKGRGAESIANRFGITTRQADKWRAAFDSRLRESLQSAIGSKLKAYADEYSVIQKSAIEQVGDLVAISKREVQRMREKSENFGSVDLKELGQAASTLKAVYQLAEQASGADVAKRKAMQPGSSEGTAGQFRLPDLSDLFAAANETVGEVIEVEESVSIMDSGNEISLSDPGSEEK
jgi:hypothetical protein